jgi:hypothetical protein
VKRESLLNRPEGKFLPWLKVGILQVNKIQSAIVTRTGQRLLFSEDQSVERAAIFRSPNANDYAVLVVLPVNSKNFCRNSSHRCLLPLTCAGKTRRFRSERVEEPEKRKTATSDWSPMIFIYSPNKINQHLRRALPSPASSFHRLELIVRPVLCQARKVR